VRRLLSLHLPSTDHLLAGHLLLVERREVVDDDWYRKSDDEHATDAARGADQFAPPGSRAVVAVANRRHRDRRPPERGRDAGELRARLVLLGEIDEAGEDEDFDAEEHHEQTELLVAALERVAERLEPGRVAGQLEHAEDSKDAQQLDDTRKVVEMFGGVRLVDSERDVVRQNGDEIDDVERTADEPAAVRRRPQPDGVLEREPADTDRLHVRQVRVVGAAWTLQRRQRVQRQADRRRHHEQNGYHSYHLNVYITVTLNAYFETSIPIPISQSL